MAACACSQGTPRRRMVETVQSCSQLLPGRLYLKGARALAVAIHGLGLQELHLQQQLCAPSITCSLAGLQHIKRVRAHESMRYDSMQSWQSSSNSQAGLASAQYPACMELRKAARAQNGVYGCVRRRCILDPSKNLRLDSAEPSFPCARQEYMRV